MGFLYDILGIYWCALSDFTFESILVYIRSSMGHFVSTLWYVWSTLVIVAYLGSRLRYVGSALVCIAFAIIFVNIRSTLGYF